jgi:hypothetical protein
MASRSSCHAGLHHVHVRCHAGAGRGRPGGGPVRLATMAAALLLLTLRSYCPPPRRVRAWLVANSRRRSRASLGGCVQAHPAGAQSSSTIDPPCLAHVNERRIVLMFPHRVAYSEPRTALSPEQATVATPLFPCRPAMDRCRSCLAVLAPCLRGSSIAVTSPTSPYSRLKWWSPDDL